ncbi:MAG: NADH-quinone oxidoreductase subunit A [Candidatus Marinimicrobia bacterium]|mgnify:FL=1|nr:NADH-quinone oxidoreductase subunit A [Candidatus Neomarinimicrobiota bacterium]
MYQNYLPIIILTGLSIILIIVPLILQSLLSPKHNKTEEKLRIYECGELPEDNAWLTFNIRFYSIALVFLIFDVEVIFLYPWAVVYNDMGLVAFVEVMIFLSILIVGFAYVWVKNDLSWVKMSLKYAQGRYSNLQKKDVN